MMTWGEIKIPSGERNMREEGGPMRGAPFVMIPSSGSMPQLLAARSDVDSDEPSDHAFPASAKASDAPPSP